MIFDGFKLIDSKPSQGWRRGMEDEHIAVKLEPPQTISSDTNVAMFGVWDGHGGQEGGF
jgi:serine/threonine protein phosphatase PrpC